MRKKSIFFLNFQVKFHFLSQCGSYMFLFINLILVTDDETVPPNDKYNGDRDRD